MTSFNFNTLKYMLTVLKKAFLQFSLQLDGIAPLVADPSWCNSITQSGKITVSFEPIMQFKNLSGFKFTNAVQHCLFYDWLHYLNHLGLA